MQNYYYHILAVETISTTFNKYRISNSQFLSICVLNSCQFRLLSQAYIKAIIKRNWKEFKKEIQKNLTSFGENYFGYIIYFPGIFLNSIMFQVMLVILSEIITGWCFLPRIEIMISPVVHVLKVTKVLGGTINVTIPT